MVRWTACSGLILRCARENQCALQQSKQAGRQVVGIGAPSACRRLRSVLRQLAYAAELISCIASLQAAPDSSSCRVGADPEC
jgi:hypothetical protein